MGPPRYAVSRQKACEACVSAKAKCDRQPVRCGRCVLRGLSCVYPLAGGKPGGNYTPGPESVSPEQNEAVLVDADDSVSLVSVAALRADMRASGVPLGRVSLDRAGVAGAVAYDELVCPIKAEDISIRWMNAYVPTAADQAVKAYQPSTIAFLHRSLKAYAGMAVRGRAIPPFIHPAQMDPGTGTSSSSAALTTCLSLVRICDTTLAGSSRTTANAAAVVLRREMDRLYAAVQQLAQPGAIVDHFASLAAFQAYLLYALVLFFQPERPAEPSMRQAIVALQEIACISARHGLVCTAEHAGSDARPQRAAWIVAEAKRRTLYVVYLFDSVLSAHDGLPSYLGTELRGLPAPSCRELWQAASLSDWNAAYQLHLNDWTEDGGVGLTIDELWAFPFPEDAAGVARRRRRVDRWLESLDEYGTMMYAVTSSTHGG